MGSSINTRQVQAMLGKFRVNSPERRLSALLLLLAVFPAVAVGIIAYTLMSDHIRSDEIKAVGQVADAKHSQLAALLERQTERAELFLSNLTAQCEGRAGILDPACVDKLTKSHLASEGALGATLWRGGHAVITVGMPAVQEGQGLAFQAGQLARLSGIGPKNNQSYFIQASNSRAELQVAVAYPASALQPIFDKPEVLGESGETFLVDAEGYFVTQGRYPAMQGHEQGITAQPMRACLSGKSGDVLDLDYRDAKIIHGFRFVREIGGGCIMAHIDQAEAFAPLKSLEKIAAAALLIFIIPVAFAALYFARRIGKADSKLRSNEQKLRLLFESASDCLMLLDLNGRILEINQTGYERLGYTKEEMVGKIVAQFDSPEFARRVPARMGEIHEKLATTFESAHVRKDGSVMPVEINARLIEMDGQQKIFSVVRDVTERKRHEDQFALMIRTSLDGFWISDERGRFLEVNDAYCQLIGYTRKELLGMGIPDIEAIETPDDTARHLEELMKAGYVRFETRHRRRDGSIIDVEVSALHTQEYGGRIYCFLRDITDRKRAEDLLRESAERLQSHIVNTPMAFVAWDGDYRVTHWSGEAEKMFGWSAAETIGKPLMDLHMVYEPDIPLVQETMVKLAAANTRYVVSSNRNISKDGRVIECVWYNTVLSKKDGTMGGVMSQVLDVTEQRCGERELRDSEQRFKTLAAATYEGVAITAQGEFIDVNDQLTQILGYERLELIGMRVIDAIAPEGRDRVMAHMDAGLASHVEFEMIRKDGSRVAVEARGHIIRQDGIPVLLTAIRDVSARVKVAEDMEAAKAEAERANDAKSRFLAAASHDLRQPLTALKLYVSVLKNKLNQEDQELLLNLQECVAGLGNLLSKLLDLSKLDAGVVTPRVRDFDLDEVLNNVCATHAPEAESKALLLRCGYFGITARSDSVLYQRIIGNYVANAIRYTKQGGVLIGCRRREGRMWVEVWDTGIGIPPDKIGEIFEEFKQLGDDARTLGSGLGLTIVAKTASVLGLQIRVQSRPNRGSMFAIELPLGAGRVASEAKSGKLSRSVRVAVVDDNPAVLNALVCGLESIGHDVVPGRSGADLLARLSSRPPEIMVCDYRLAGGETGFDVVSLVRTAFGKDLPAIIITGDTDPQVMRSMINEDMAVLHKPVDIEDLQERIEGATMGPALAIE